MTIRSQMVLRQDLTDIVPNASLDNNFVVLANAADAILAGTAGYEAGNALKLGGRVPAASPGASSIPLTNTDGGLTLPSGNLLLCVASGGYHILNAPTSLSTSENQQCFGVGARSGTFFNALAAFTCYSYSPNAAAAAVKFGHNSTTSRSISAGGTINASGADYAEYERKSDSCGTIEKGQIVGFDAHGELTNRWSEAISFGVKSTNPSYVGGDTWGTADKVGNRPEEPIFERPAYSGVLDPGPEPQPPSLQLPLQPIQQAGETDETFVVRTAIWQQACSVVQQAHDLAKAQYQEDYGHWQQLKAAFDTDWSTYLVTLDEAEVAHAAVLEQYKVDLTAFETRLETARQQVDRVAYSGKCPVNITGAKVGDYIIATEDGEGGITGQTVAEPTFEEYRRAVGRVRRILDDGRAEIAVIVH